LTLPRKTSVITATTSTTQRRARQCTAGLVHHRTTTVVVGRGGGRGGSRRQERAEALRSSPCFIRPLIFADGNRPVEGKPRQTRPKTRPRKTRARAATATTRPARDPAGEGDGGRGEGEGKEKKRGSNDWLDTSCRTEATVGLIKLRELAEVSSGLFRGAGNGEARKGRMTAGEKQGEREREREREGGQRGGEAGTVLYSDTNKFSRNGIVFEVDTFAE